MADEARLWRVRDDDTLTEVTRAHLDLEARIESWLKDDISILASDLLVIGQQVETDFGGFIDLLCINETGDLVVVELKRDKTPRDITAQALDYGSWVTDLSHERIRTIAEEFLDRELEEVFKSRFGSELPETLNSTHGLIVVGSRIDPSSERIIKYLSRVHGVNINAATFQYFKEPDGSELLARVFLMEPDEVDTNVSRGPTKRQRNLTYAELEERADESGVGELYRYAVSALERHLHRGRTRSSIAFIAQLGESRNTVVSLIPGDSSADEGLRFQVYFLRLSRLLKLPESEVEELLPKDREPWEYYQYAEPEWTGFQGFIKSTGEVDQLVSRF